MSDSAVRVLFLGDSSSAVRSVSRLESAFGGLGRTAKLVTGALAIGIVGGLAAATKAAIDFDRSMRNVNSIAKLSEGQFKSLEKRVLSLGKTTGQSPKVLADGLYDIVSSGFKADDAIKILAVSAKAATAGMTDTATASKAVVAILNAYHLSASKARNVSSLLFTEVNKGVNTFEELATNIGDTAPLAAQLKIPFSDVAAGLALITLHGTSMAEASTQMSRVMTDLLKPSDSLKKILHGLGYENGQAAIEAHGFIPLIGQLSKAASGSAAKTADWFQNIRSLRGILNLTGPNLKLFNKFADDMAASFRHGGADVKAFNEQSKSISVQWQKAKAALTAAAIPIGQLLFPLLSKAAAKAQDFATGLTSHMPQIREQFQQLGGIVHSLVASLGELGRVAISPAGSAGIIGVLASVQTARGILRVKEGLLGAEGALSRLGPAGVAAAAGVGIVAGAIIWLARNGSLASHAIDEAARAIDGLKHTSDAAAQANLSLRQAQITVKTTADAVAQAERTYNQAVQQSGRGSLTARTALHALQQARQDHRQSLLDEKHAAEANTAAQAENAQQSRASKAAVGHLTSEFKRLTNSTVEFQPHGKAVGTTIGANNAQMKAGLVENYANAMLHLSEQAAKVAPKLAEAARTASALADSLNRIPSRKEIDIFIRTFGSADAVIQGRRHTRAHGGFIPGPVGAPVPILAHAGEIVLNPKQQSVLGGPRFLSQLFGFSGDEGPGFATGGIVSKPKRKKSGHSPHSHRRPRTKTTGRAARSALSAVEKVNQSEEDLDRSYGQLVRLYDITPEQYLVTNDSGVDVVNQSGITVGGKFVRGIDQRVAEIDSLLASRQQMLDLIDQEKKRLKAAIKKLQAAVKALVAAIRAEHSAISELNHQISAERRKKKPDQKKIDRWQSAISGHNTTIGNMSSTLSEFRGAIKDTRQNLVHVLPFDRRDVELDMQTLAYERGDITTTSLPPGSSGGGAGAGVIPPNLAGLAQAVGALQGSIIGSFAKGTLHVPETGLAYVHAGERIIPAGQKRGGDGGSIGDMKIEVQLTGDLKGLEQFIRVTAVKASPDIGAEIGRRGDERLRGGRY